MTDLPTLQVPYDVDAERALLGCLIVERDNIIAVAPLVQPGHFYLDKHALIYAAILSLYERREPPDYTTLTSELRRRGQLAAVGGDAYLVELMAPGRFVYVHGEYYAGVVRRTAKLRQLITLGGQIAGLGYQTGLTDDEALSRAAGLFQQLYSDSPAQWDDLGGVIEDVIAGIPPDGAAPQRGLPTGFATLNQETYGWGPSDFILLAGRTSQGKSALAQNFALTAAQAGAHVGFVSLEMAKRRLGARFLAMESRTDLGVIRNGTLGTHDWDRVSAALGSLQLPIHLLKMPTLTISALRAQAQRLAADPARGLDLLIVDYLQLMAGEGATGNREQEVARISRGLKVLAMEMDIPVIALTQLSRAAVQAERPELHHLRESGAQEQDADIVLLLHKPDPDQAPRRVDLILAKNRDGDTGDIPLEWHGPTQRFIEVPAPALLRAG
jgi:replicative DNA helicase